MQLQLGPRGALLAAVMTASATAQCNPAPGRWPAWVTSAAASGQWQRLAAVDGAQCRAALRAAGVRFTVMPDRAAPDARGCGIPHGVVVTRGPTGIVYEAPLVIDCSLARAIPAMEAVIQEAAMTHLGQRITRIGTLGTFACRPMRGGSGFLSEHAIGDAMDWARFVPRRGAVVTVARDYGRSASGARSLFLQAVADGVRGVEGVSHVLGPWYNAEHRDHFHVDGAWRWWRQGW